jgi:large subunit ribosomal protein L5e
MVFVKVQKNSTYSRRFQVKFRRRRQGKTDYYQRKRLVVQRKNKYNTPKWRFVVRRTNARIICQVVSSTIAGDRVKVSADSYELKRFGLEAGLTNFAAAYATGLLTARRLLTVLDEDNKKRNITTSMASTFNLVPETTGEYVNIAELAEKKGVETRPFTAFLDLGLARATVGNRVFAAMKGAVDGGLHIPHSDKIFPKAGGKEVASKGKKDAGKKEEKKPAAGNALRDRIFGVHVQNYMDLLKKEGDAYNRQFSGWDKNLKKAGVKTLEELYKKVHSAIRAKPIRAPKSAPKGVKHTVDSKDKNIRIVNGKKYRKDVRLTREARKAGIASRYEQIRKYIAERKK